MLHFETSLDLLLSPVILDRGEAPGKDVIYLIEHLTPPKGSRQTPKEEKRSQLGDGIRLHKVQGRPQEAEKQGGQVQFSEKRKQISPGTRKGVRRAPVSRQAPELALRNPVTTYHASGQVEQGTQGNGPHLLDAFTHHDPKE